MDPLELAVFLLIGALATFAGVMVVFARRAVHSAIFLVLNLFCVAVLYLSLNAEFLAAVQLLVYAGAIVVLFLFVITLLNPRAEEGPDWLGGQVPAAFILGAALLVEVGVTVATTLGGIAGLTKAGATALANYPPAPITWGDNVRALGLLMFTDYLLPFEVTSILLLIALLGATVLAKGRLQSRKKIRGGSAPVSADDRQSGRLINQKIGIAGQVKAPRAVAGSPVEGTSAAGTSAAGASPGGTPAVGKPAGGTLG